MILLILSLTCVFAFSAWKQLSSGILLLLALLPSYLLRTEIFGIPTTLLELMLLVLATVWITQNKHRRRELIRLKKTWSIGITLIVLAATLSAIIAPDTFKAWGVWKAYFIEPIFFFYLLKDTVQQKQLSEKNIYQALIVGGILVSLVALAQWILSTGIPIPWDIEHRVTGIFDYPNALGLYLGPLAIIAFGLTIHQFSRTTNKHQPLSVIPNNHMGISVIPSDRAQCTVIQSDQRKPRDYKYFWTFTEFKSAGFTFYLAAFLLFTLVIVLAKSEATLVALAFTTVFIGITHTKLRKLTILLTICTAVVLLIIPTSRMLLIEKLTLQDYSGQVRQIQWSETWNMMTDNPKTALLGTGLSGYPIALKPFHQATHLEIFQYPHHIFLNIWTELGLLGLIAFLYLTYLLCVTKPGFVKTRFRQNRVLTTSEQIALFALIGMFIHGLVDVPYFKNDLAILTWTLLALVYVDQKTHAYEPTINH